MMKKILLISSLIVIVILAMEVYQENFGMSWQKYQRKYKQELKRLAQTEKEKRAAEKYQIKLRQIVLPEFNNRSDRCISCHVAMEDERMRHMPHPLKSHPGDYLKKHDMTKIGCTFCHDGQGRAITVEDAHAQAEHKFWEKPILNQPFIQANCSRCHMEVLPELKEYNRGKQIFETIGCTACHKIKGEGGTIGPDLTDIGNASFYMKAPVAENREKLLEKFHYNVNLAYLYEAVKMPAAQPATTLMTDYKFSEQDAIALVVYLKSLTAKRRVMDVGMDKMIAQRQNLSQDKSLVSTEEKEAPPSEPTDPLIPEDVRRGYAVYAKHCVACHTIGKGRLIGPDLKDVTKRRDQDWIRRFIKKPSVMLQEDPIAIELLKEYQVPMTDLGLTDQEVHDVVKYLQRPFFPEKKKETVSDSKNEISRESINRKVTPEDILKGRDLFQGRERLFHQGPSCISCHQVASHDIISAGSLGPDLTQVFSRLGQEGIRQILKTHPFPVKKAAYKKTPLTEEEIFTLTAFLEKTNQIFSAEQPNQNALKILALGLLGASLFLGIYTMIWCQKKEDG